jgi:hypothetical protein
MKCHNIGPRIWTTSLERHKKWKTDFIYFLAYFPYFEKVEVGLCDHHAVCVSVYPSYERLNG